MASSETTSNSWSRRSSFIYVLAAYIVASASAVGVGWILLHYGDGGSLNLWVGAAGTAAATVVVFLFSLGATNSSVFDPFWSVIPPGLAIFWIVTADNGAEVKRQVLVATSVWIWGLRLTLNWALSWEGLSHEDWRYVDIRRNFGANDDNEGAAFRQRALYWAFGSLCAIHIVPAVQIFLGSLPMYVATNVGRVKEANLVDWIALVICLGAVAIETVSDWQLKRFRQSRKDPNEFINFGLWRYSRHPNYFGEATFWLGLYVFALAAATRFWWTGAGFITISAMLVFASIPLADKRMLKRKPAYEDILNSTSACIPWFPRSRRNDHSHLRAPVLPS